MIRKIMAHRCTREEGRVEIACFHFKNLTMGRKESLGAGIKWKRGSAELSLMGARGVTRTG